MTRAEHLTFAANLRREVDAVAIALPPRARELATWQACLESGWGSSRVAVEFFNFWNLTAGGDGTRTLKHYMSNGGRVWRQENADWEYASPGARPVGKEWTSDGHGCWRKRIPQNWRAYLSPSESITDYLKWMHRPDYGAVLNAMLEGDDARWCFELRRVVFFTLPAEEYLRRLRGVGATITAKESANV